MKVTRNLCTLLLLSSLLSLAFINLGSAPTLPAFKVEPTYYTGRTGGTFYVNINVYDADYDLHTDVYAYQVCMAWDPLVVDIDDVVIWGDFLDAPRVGPWGLLTAEAAAVQKIVNVADGSKFDPNYVVLIEDDSNSEWNEIASVAGNQLTMKNNLAHTYTMAAGGGAYPKPDLTPTQDIRHDTGRIMCGQTTNGPAPGAQGNGWLCTLKFHILDEVETALDIDHPVLGQYTFLINHLGETLGDQTGELIKESGYFILPLDEDLNADGVVDIFDLSSVALKFGETGSPGWIPEDINGDGYVNVIDLTLVSLQYGTYANY